MANTNAPFGFRQYSGNGSAPTYEQVEVLIAYNATNIFNGDPVEPDANGLVVQGDGTTAAAGIAGIFVGCTYTNPSTKQPTWAQYWPAGIAAADAQAYVVDDPDVLFKVAAVSSGTTVAFYAQTVVGNNVALVQNSGSTNTGDSAVAINGSTVAATASLPIRIVAGVPDTANASGEFCEFICKFNAPYPTITIDFTGETASVATAGGHMYNNASGV